MKKDKEMIEIEQKLAAKKTMDELVRLIDTCEKKKADMLIKAKKAKQRNDTTNYKLVCTGLASAIANKNRAEKMLLTMQIVADLTDLSKATTGFIGCMKDMSHDLAAVAKNNKFGKVGKEFNKAMAGAQMQMDSLDDLVENTNASMGEMTFSISDDLLAEIDALIDNEAVAEETDFDKAIEEKMERLKRKN